MKLSELKNIIRTTIMEKKLCPKGKAYYNRRIAAGESPSAYLSGRAVKVCKGLMNEYEDLSITNSYVDEDGDLDFEQLQADLIKLIPYFRSKLPNYLNNEPLTDDQINQLIEQFVDNLTDIWGSDWMTSDDQLKLSSIWRKADIDTLSDEFTEFVNGLSDSWDEYPLDESFKEAINPLGWEPIIKAESGEIERTAEDLGLPYDVVYDSFVNGKEVTLNNDIWARLENTDSYDINSEEEAIELAKQYGKDIQSILAAKKTPPALILQYAPNKYYLVGGNTRLMVARVKGINPQVILATIEPKNKWAYQDVTGTIDESLRDWFKKEDWVRIDTQGNITGDCGTMKKGKATTRCLPRAKANRLTKAERAATARKKAAEDRKGDRVVPNTDKAKVRFRK